MSSANVTHQGQYFANILECCCLCERLLIFLSKKPVLCKCSCNNVSRSQWIPLIGATACEAWLVAIAVIHALPLLLREVLGAAGRMLTESWG